jgi:hypothetical protein
MRSDFAKVVTERPRSGSRCDRGPIINRRGREDFLHEDFSVKREPMSMGRGTKRFTDVLGPLRGYLRQQIGRPWNKVYSELCDHFNKNSVSQSHILDHIKDFVELKVQYKVHGKKKNYPCDMDGNRITGSSDKYFKLFVCPNTNILKMAPIENYRAEYKKRNAAAKNGEVVTVGDKKFICYDEIWYEIKLATAGENTVGRDNLLNSAVGMLIRGHVHRVWSSERSRLYGDGNLYVTSRRQLNKNEIRRFKLRD